MKKNTNYKANNYAKNRVRTVRRSYQITSQTDYHIQRMAKIAGVSEGRIIDKIMRAYLTNLDNTYDNYGEQ